MPSTEQQFKKNILYLWKIQKKKKKEQEYVYFLKKLLSFGTMNVLNFILSSQFIE